MEGIDFWNIAVTGSKISGILHGTLEGITEGVIPYPGSSLSGDTYPVRGVYLHIRTENCLEDVAFPVQLHLDESMRLSLKKSILNKEIEYAYTGSVVDDKLKGKMLDIEYKITLHDEQGERFELRKTLFRLVQ